METLTKPAPDADRLPPEAGDLRGLSLHDQFEEIKKLLFDDLPGEQTGDPALDAELEFVSQTVDELAEKTWTKISEQLGSNEGGWYENKDGQHFYLKFYDDPDQARVEFVANQIYCHLGVKAARSELMEVDGRLAIASAEVPGAHDAGLDQQQSSSDLRAGFVADAYLANWDVIGLCYDNVVANDDGCWRIDNGGSIIFRAQGGLKNFPAHDVPELETMQNPEFTAGQVFAGITEAEMAAQAKDLAYMLYPELLEQLVFYDAGFSGEVGGVGEAIYQGLLGRRQFLVDRFGLEEDQSPEPAPSRLKGLIDKIDRRAESQNQNPESFKIRDREVIISDEDHIENQTVNIIDARDRGCLEVRFKLTADHYQKILDRLQNQLEAEEAAGELLPSIQNGEILYRSANPDCEPIIRTEAFRLLHDYLPVKIARPVFDKRDSELEDDMGRARSFLGLVAIDIPYRDGAGIELDEVEDRINDILVNLLDVPAGLTEPTPEAERRYKQARYAWHHCLDPETVARDYAEALDDYMQRQEVFDNYSTMVCEGTHYHYENTFGEYAPYHCLWYPELIPGILKSGGLMSSHERYSRGQPLEGMSTLEDLDSGGGDSVFCRTIVDSAQQTPTKQTIPPGRYHIVMGPELFDRTDWYSYPSDYYGSTSRDYFDHRYSPQELLAHQKQRGLEQLDEDKNDAQVANEQMFRTGIGSQAFRGIACHSNSNDRKRLTDALLQRLTPDQKQQHDLYVRGSVAVRAFLEQKCGQKDIVNQTWDRGPQAVRDLLAHYEIEQIVTDHGPKPVNDWLKNNNRMDLIDSLRRAGFEQINGQPVEDFVVEAQNQYDFVDIAHGRPVRSKDEANRDRAYRRPPPPKTQDQILQDAPW